MIYTLLPIKEYNHSKEKEGEKKRTGFKGGLGAGHASIFW